MKYDSRRPRQGFTLAVFSSLTIYAVLAAAGVAVWGLWLLGRVLLAGVWA